jgi:serine/threonine-protein kinase
MQTAPLASRPSSSGVLPFETGLLDGTSYRAIRPLGKGGMGEVFEAEHIALGKRVVVKLLRLELCADGSLVERLRLEAQAMARLDHPGIAGVHDMGVTAAGRPYFVLDYLSGRSLQQEIRASGPLPVREAVRIALEVLDALAAAHEAGLVHRDVKPGNVFLCDPDRRGRRAAKLLDFGIVKVTAGAFERSFPTEQGQFVGSPTTASPEQARGEAVGAPSDIYAVGLLLHMMIAGRSPFAGSDAGSALVAHVYDVPPPLSKDAAQPVPPLLDIAVARALSKKPEERYPSARAMATVLERVLSRLPPEETGPSEAAARPRDPASPPQERGRFGTELLGVPRRGQSPNAGKAPDGRAINVHPGRLGAARGLALRWVSAYQRVPLAARVAAGSTLVFFVLLWLFSRLFLGTR